MKSLSPYIVLHLNTDKTTDIYVNDWELFDFLEDYLIEKCDIEYKYFYEFKQNKKTIYVMHFPKKYEVSKTKDYLSKLDINEIKDIYLLNNSPIIRTHEAKKVILVSSKDYGLEYQSLLKQLLERGIELFCAVGKDCEKWEDAIDWLYVENNKIIIIILQLRATLMKH